MSKFLISLGFMLISASVLAKGMEFFHGSWDEALAEAKKQEKLLFVDVYTDWCGPCKIMDKEVFPRDEVGDFYNANFINYELDAEKGDGPAVAERYQANSYPSFLFVNGEGELVHSAGSAVASAAFIEMGKEVLGQSQSFPDMMARYQEGDRTVDFVRSYLLKAPLYGSKLPRGSEVTNKFWEGISKAAEDYFASRQPEALINADDFGLIKQYLNGSDRGNPANEVVFSHYDAFVKLAPEASVATYIQRTNNLTIHDLSGAGDLAYKKYVEEIRTNEAIKKAIAYSKKTADKSDKNAQLDSYTIMRLAAEINYAMSKKDWMKYVESAEEYVNFEGDSASAISFVSSAGRMLQSGCDDLEAFKRIVKMTRKGYEMEKHTYVVSTYGKVLAKIGENEKAKVILDEAISLYGDGMEKYKKELEELIKTL